MTYIYSIIILIFLLPVTNEVEVCDCARIENWRTATVGEYEYVKDVFIGEVKKISEDKTEYEFVVLEVFKGNLKVGRTVKGINPKYCEPDVNKKGHWLFFGAFSDNFNLNECGLTSNIEEPWRILPPPPPPELKADEKKMIKRWKKEVRENMQEQISILREISD